MNKKQKREVRRLVERQESNRQYDERTRLGPSKCIGIVVGLSIIVMLISGGIKIESAESCRLGVTVSTDRNYKNSVIHTNNKKPDEKTKLKTITKKAQASANTRSFLGGLITIEYDNSSSRSSHSVGGNRRQREGGKWTPINTGPGGWDLW